MDNFSQIQCFLKVAELKSFSKAADDLHITPTAVSKQIKNLEASIEEQLFVRTTRRVTLTEFGEHLYTRCKVLDNQMQSIQHFIESKKEVPQGELKVLVSSILSRSFVLKKLARFMRQYPDIKLELIFSEGDIDLIRDDIDIMVGFPQIPPATDIFRYRKLFVVNNILCASKAFLKKYGKPKSEADLLKLPFISHSQRRPGNRLPLANGNWLDCADPILFMNHFEALNQACRDGIGIFLTGDTLVEEDLANGTLIQLLPRTSFRSWDIFTFYRAYEYELPKIRAFLDFFS